jgi:hypothetical protein
MTNVECITSDINISSNSMSSIFSANSNLGDVMQVSYECNDILDELLEGTTRG